MRSTNFISSIFFITLFLVTSCGWLGDVSVKKSADIQSLGGTGRDQNTSTPGSDLPPMLVASTSGPVQVGQCWPAIIAATKSGAAANVTAEVPLSLAVPSNLTLYSEATCNSSITSATISTGSSSVVVFYRATAAGAFAVGVSDTTAVYLPTTFVADVQSGGNDQFPSRVAIQGPDVVNAGSCTAYTLIYKDVNNLDASFSNQTIAYLSQAGVGGQFYSNASCSGAQINQYTIPGGVSSSVFYYRNQFSGLNTIQALANNVQGSLSVSVVAAAASKFVISGPSSILKDGCNPYILETQDAYGNSSNLSAATSATLSTSITGGLFYSNASCASSISTVSLNKGTSLAQIYFKSPNSGLGALVAHASNFTDGSLNISVIAAPVGGAAQIAFSTAITETSAGTCSGPIKATVQDINGNTVSYFSAFSVELSNSGSGAFYSDSGCNNSIATIAAGSNFYFRDTVAETVTLVGSDPAKQLGSAVKSLKVTPGSLYKIVLNASVKQFAAGNCQEFLAIYTDSYNNPVSVTQSTNVYLSEKTLGNGVFYSDNACGSVLPTDTASGNQYLGFAPNTFQRFFYFRSTKAGRGLMNAEDGVVNPGTFDFDVVPGAVAKITVTPPSTGVLAGSCSGAFRLSLWDAYDNKAVSNSNLSFALSANAGAFYKENTCQNPITSILVNAGTSDAYFNYRNASVGTITGVAQSGSFSNTFNFQVTGSNAPTRLAVLGKSPLTRGSGTAFAGGCLALLVNAEDTLGNPVGLTSAVVASLNSTNGGSFYSNSTCTQAATSIAMAAGSTAATLWFKGNNAVTTTLSATATGLSAFPFALSIQPGALSAIKLQGPVSLTAGLCAGPYSVSGNDSYGNTVALANGTSVSLSGGASGNFYRDGNCSNATTYTSVTAPQVSAVFYYRNTKSEVVTLKATQSSRNAELGVNIRPGGANHYRLTGDLQSVVGQCSGVLAFGIYDMYGNVIVNAGASRAFNLLTSGSVKVYTDNTCTTPVISVAIPAGASTSNSFRIKGAVVENFLLTISSSSVGCSAAGSVFNGKITAPPVVVPTVDLKAAVPGSGYSNGPVSLAFSQNAQLSWTTTNATSCVVQPGGYTGTSNTGIDIGPVRSSVTYTLTCQGTGGGSASDSVIINVKGNWYQVNGQECVSYCSIIGRSNTASFDGFRCVSGEERPASSYGVINFVYGTWHSSWPAEGAPGAMSAGKHCYHPGQKRDGDKTDITVGCYCE